MSSEYLEDVVAHVVAEVVVEPVLVHLRYLLDDLLAVGLSLVRSDLRVQSDEEEVVWVFGVLAEESADRMVLLDAVNRRLDLFEVISAWLGTDEILELSGPLAW